MYKSTFSVALALMAAQAEAWWAAGHLLTARRAQAILEESYPEVLQAAISELTELDKYFPDLVSGEGDHPFTECATFADDIKSKGYTFQSDWHFVNTPYLDEEGTSLDDFSFEQPVYDVIGAMTDIKAYLKGDITASESYYIPWLVDKTGYESDAKSFGLRLLIHYVGDVHQPEHSVALVDSTYPTGDRGGNSEKIPSKNGVNNLHFVWDSVVYKYTDRVTLPFSDSDWDFYTSESASISSSYPVSDDELKAGDFQAWADEDLEVA